MLNMQAQEPVRESVTSVVYRAVAENGSAFKEDVEKRLQEKDAEEANKLRELRQKATDDVLDVSKSKIEAASAKAEEAPERPAVEAEPVAGRGDKVDVYA